MSKKKNKKYVITSQQLFDAAKPQWNGWQVGHGPHSDNKYNRNKVKQEWRKMIY